MTESIIGHIVRDVELAGESIAALDPEGKSSDADMQQRLGRAEIRLKLMFLQQQLKEAEESTSCFSLFGAFQYRKFMLKTLESMQELMPGIGLEAADPKGKATAAEVAERLTLSEKRLCEVGALRLVNELEKFINGSEKPYAGQYRRMLQDIDAFTAHTDGKIGLTRPGTDAEKRITDIMKAACMNAAAEELQDFEKMPAPKSLNEIDERADRIVSLFNRASVANAAGVTLGDAPVATVQERMEEAGIRARDLYYAAGGKLPVMKRIRLAAPHGGAA